MTQYHLKFFRYRHHKPWLSAEMELHLIQFPNPFYQYTGVLFHRRHRCHLERYGAVWRCLVPFGDVSTSVWKTLHWILVLKITPLKLCIRTASLGDISEGENGIDIHLLFLRTFLELSLKKKKSNEPWTITEQCDRTNTFTAERRHLQNKQKCNFFLSLVQTSPFYNFQTRTHTHTQTPQIWRI